MSTAHKAARWKSNLLTFTKDGEGGGQGKKERQTEGDRRTDETTVFELINGAVILRRS